MEFYLSIFHRFIDKFRWILPQFQFQRLIDPRLPTENIFGSLEWKFVKIFNIRYLQLDIAESVNFSQENKLFNPQKIYKMKSSVRF